MSEIETVGTLPTLVKKKHELAKVQKALEAGSLDAVKLLSDTMNSNDEEITLKTKLECAKFIIQMQAAITDQISKDSLTRQIAQIKIDSGSLKYPRGDSPEGEKPSTPKLDFETVQIIEDA